MKIETLKRDIVLLLNNFIEENQIEVSDKLDEDSRLIGSASVFDSMELVSFIVDVEEFLEENYNLELQLASEKAMSRRNSPFISAKALSEYIIEISNE